MNTVDAIFPSWPVFLYTNPELGRFLLEPLLAYQATGLYPNPWAAHDIGSSYPQAVGHNDGKLQQEYVVHSIMTASQAMIQPCQLKVNLLLFKCPNKPLTSMQSLVIC